jgi:hypothetical protein
MKSRIIHQVAADAFPVLTLLIFAAASSSSLDWLWFPCACPVIHQKISMSNTGVLDLDAGIVVEKRGRGRPRGSKNKPKVATMASSSAQVKRCPGRPLGSKNKSKSSTSQVNEPPDVSATHLNPPLPSTGTVFSFFALAGAQCRAQQRVPDTSQTYL